MKKIHLGDKIKDEVSGITGIVVGITTFIHGCERITLAPQPKKGSVELPETFTIDLPQAVLVKRGVVSTTNPLDDNEKKTNKKTRKTGGPAPYRVSKF